MKNILLIIAAVVILSLVGFFFVNSYISDEKQGGEWSHEQKEELVSSYIEGNISQLSPEPEVLGGTFYVTNIEFSGPNSGTVEYEDGHIALVADFEYSLNEEGIDHVELTNVRENRPE